MTLPFNDDGLILIGRLTKPQGHRGAVRMLPEFEPLERFEDLKSDEIILRPGERPTAPAVMPKGKPHVGLAHIEGFFFHGQFIVLELAEIEDMNQAELLRDSLVYVREEDLWDLQPGEFLVHELDGFQVVDAQDGHVIGALAGIHPGAAHDFLKVKPDSRSEFLVPFVKAVVVEMDKATKLVRVQLPPGLEDL